METKSHLHHPSSRSTTGCCQESAQTKETLSLLMPTSSIGATPPECRCFNPQDNLGFHSSQEKLCPGSDKPSSACKIAMGNGRMPPSSDFVNRRWKRHDASFGKRRCRRSKVIRRSLACLSFVVIACLLAGMLVFCVRLNAKVEDLLNDLDSGRGSRGRNESAGLVPAGGRGRGGGGGRDEGRGDYDGSRIMQALLGVLKRHPSQQLPNGTKAGRTKRQAYSNDAYEMEQDEVDRWNEYIRSVIRVYNLEMDKVRLQGVTDGESHDGNYLAWQSDRFFMPRGVTLHYNKNGSITGIQINNRGTYVVYSRVTVHGREWETHRHDCLHETVEIMYPPYGDYDGPSARIRVLMSGYLTQDNLGRAYPNRTYEFPRDSSVQIGLFKLLNQSQVRVRVPNDEGCRNLMFSSGQTSASFGLWRID